MVSSGPLPAAHDHMPYINRGRPSILSIHRSYGFVHYHRSTDLPENLGPFAQAIGSAIMRMNVAAVATWSARWTQPRTSSSSTASIEAGAFRAEAVQRARTRVAECVHRGLASALMKSLASSA